MITVVFAQAPSGVIEGGWGYIIAAYLATWIFFLGYTASLVVRERAVRETLNEPTDALQEEKAS